MSKALFLLSLFLILITSCTTTVTDSTSNSAEISESDSLKIVSSILDDMIEEMYFDNFITTNPDTTRINDNPFGIPYCGYRLNLNIRLNSQNKLMIHDELIDDLNEISPWVVNYFSANEETNDLYSPFPLFSRASEQEISETVNRMKEEITALKKNQKTEKDVLKLKQDQLEEWEIKLRAIQTFGIEELPEVHNKALVDISSQEETSAAFKSQVRDSVIIGFYRLREQCAQKYFNESYLRIWYRHQTYPTNKDKDKLEAIRCIKKVRVIDHSALKKYRRIYATKEYEIGHPW